MTPKEFAEAMREIAAGSEDDRETAHISADDLMLKTLESLGFTEGVSIFKNMARWYA